MGFFGNAIKQMRIYIGADSETEDASVAFAALLHAGDNLVFICGADSRATIRKKDNDEGARMSVGFSVERERFLERVIDGSATNGFQVFDKIFGLRAIRFIGFDELIEKRFDLS